MTSIKKLINKFSNNPDSLRYAEIEKILLHLEFEKAQGKGSHVKFSHLDCDKTLVFAIHNNDCRKAYKKSTLNILIKNHFLKP